jgi:hypothetical protein
VIATAVCVALGSMTGLLVWLVPVVWVPVGAGVAVTGLALTLYGLWYGRQRN